MQDIQSIPNPDVNSTERAGEFGNHPDIERENESDRSVEDIPLPPTEPTPSPVEEPPADKERSPIDEPPRSPKENV